MLFSKFFRRLGIWLSYVTIVAAGCAAFLFFRFPINVARVKGKKNIPRRGHGILFVSNHIGMLDSFLIGGVAFFPRMIFYPSEPFVNFAAKENFFGKWYTRVLMRLLRAEPVEYRSYAPLMKKYVKLLPSRNLLIFYQGGRSKNLDQIVDGPSFAIRNAHPTPTVIPVFHEGIDRIFSRGGPKTQGTWRWLPRNLFRRPTVLFGPPIDFSQILGSKKTREEQTEEINKSITKAVSNLKRQFDTEYKNAC